MRQVNQEEVRMISIKRIVGIVFVFLATTVAWLIFGGVMTMRAHDQSSNLRGDVAELWGSPQRQVAPTLIFHWTTWEDQERTEKVEGKTKTVRQRVAVHHSDTVLPRSTAIEVGLDLDQRLKGLVWYALYDVSFAGRWRYTHERPEPGTLEVIFPFPEASGLYDDFSLTIDDQDRARDVLPVEGRAVTRVEVAPGATVVVGASYKSRGMDQWTYVPSEGVGRLEQFTLQMTTDFDDIDFPAMSMSPSRKERRAGGWALHWEFERVITGHQIGMVMPARIQPGELAAALSFSAPISLLFFFLMLWVLATLRQIDIHPINYFFLAGAFFAFHLLFGYSVDHLTLVPAFVLASAASILLVVSYLRLVVSARFAFVEAAAAQLVYLIGFSLAHFWDGFTGLTVTVLSVITLFVLMQLTGRLRWSDLLARRS